MNGKFTQEQVAPLPKIAIACPICKKIKQLSTARYRLATRSPWACLKCRHGKKWRRKKKKPFGLAPVNVKACTVCKELHVRRSPLCSATCAGRQKRDKDYFGGLMSTALGWEQKECQVCYRTGMKKGFHVHHVYRHPDHSRMVVLCAGCHEVVSKLSWRGLGLSALERLVAYARMQRLQVNCQIAITETR